MPSSTTSSDPDTSPTHNQTNHTDFSSSIFQSYFTHSTKDSNHQSHLIKIQSFLTSSQSNALSCLICLERIKPTSPTWSCTHLCFTIFHLHCIQSWANQSLSLTLSRATSRAPVVPDVNSLKWPCPKCRKEYSKVETPKNYFCFCGSVENPVLDPWILPHSCGEVCGRELEHKCGHFCLLLCHPGPCPPCPKMVKNRCFCGRVEDVRRCGFKDFTCGGICKKVLECGVHECGKICHEGECGDCRVELDFMCECGKVVVRRECWDREFRCEGVCGERLRCGKHVCERGCHKGECGECPRQGRRSCPCGKRVYDRMACDVELPLCGGTCDKRLGCGFHKCPERCHRGECVGTCRSLVTKSCRCGSLKKQVPCYQELTCERKCQNVRDCGRHACKRKCCDGDCPPCSEICERRLRCRNHKCPAPCHRGACAPCPLMVTISCFCGETHFEVPCGTEAEQKSPKCPKQCRVAPLCTHRSNCKPHKCHYGACPPCRLTCGEEYPCGHNCKLRCHGPKPPPLPEFTLKPKKKRFNYQIEPTPGSSCPPCPELVVRSCVGQHVGVERMMVCSNKTQFSCDNLCGNPLPCGNHFCTYVCHALISRSSKSNAARSSDACEKCNLPCQRERDPTCPHACPLPCHPGECPPCKTLVKRSCHCGAMVHVFECLYFNSMSEKEQMAARSCKGPCHRKLPYCTHLCPETCHPGPCPLPDKCSKKVNVRCRCQTTKKEWLCQDVQTTYHGAGSDPKDILKNQYGLGLIPCENDCKSKVKVPDSELHFRQTKPREEKQSDSSSTASKRRRRKQRVQQDEDTSRVQRIVAAIRRILRVFIIVLVIIASAYFGFKGLMWVSDWMNKNEIGHKMRYKRI